MPKKSEVKKILKKTLEGEVVSTKMESTIRVMVQTAMRHPIYKKTIYRRKVYFAHTEKEVKEGDKVTIRESKPYSKNVRWIVVSNS